LILFSNISKNPQTLRYEKMTTKMTKIPGYHGTMLYETPLLRFRRPLRSNDHQRMTEPDLFTTTGILPRWFSCSPLILMEYVIPGGTTHISLVFSSLASEGVEVPEFRCKSVIQEALRGRFGSDDFRRWYWSVRYWVDG
jgi:hypothetical protein